MEIIARHPAARRSLRIAAGVVVASIMLFSAIVLAESIQPGTATAAPLHIDVDADGTRVVTIIDPRGSPDVVSLALSSAGIRTEIIGVPTGPSRVDTIVSISIDRDLPRRLITTPNRLTLPAGFDGTVVLGVGAATPPGQPYLTPIDPFATGEPLAHLAGVRSASEVARRARADGITVVVLDTDGRPVPEDELGRATILVAVMVAPGSVTIRLE